MIIELLNAESERVREEEQKKRIVTYAKNIIIPDGIEYIDIAESEILDSICTEAAGDSYYDLHPMYEAGETKYKTYSETSGNYDGNCSYSSNDPIIPAYKQFRYVRNLESVTFEGPQVFPDNILLQCLLPARTGPVNRR